jgi:hypothetical protein
MTLGTHMPDGERRKPIDIEVCRSKVKVSSCITFLVLLVITYIKRSFNKSKHNIFKKTNKQRQL